MMPLGPSVGSGRADSSALNHYPLGHRLRRVADVAVMRAAQSFVSPRLAADRPNRRPGVRANPKVTPDESPYAPCLIKPKKVSAAPALLSSRLAVRGYGKRKAPE
jgi:hypothetical protein